MTHWGRSLLTSSEDKTAFFNAPTHSILQCQQCLKEAMGLVFPLALGFCGKQNRMETLTVLSSGFFTQGGATGKPSYSLCMCDIPNPVAGPEWALGSEGLVEEEGRSDDRFQLRHRPQLWLLLLGEKREGEHRGEPLMALLKCEYCSPSRLALETGWPWEESHPSLPPQHTHSN